jgi:hypothetical protein
MADAKDKGKKDAPKGVRQDVDDLEARVAHLESAVGSSLHPTEEEQAEQAEAAAKEREQMEKDAEKAAEEAAEEQEKAAEPEG